MARKRRPAAGGIGSNQYQSKPGGGATVASSARIEAFGANMAAVEREASVVTGERLMSKITDCIGGMPNARQLLDFAERAHAGARDGSFRFELDETDDLGRPDLTDTQDDDDPRDIVTYTAAVRHIAAQVDRLIEAGAERIGSKPATPPADPELRAVYFAQVASCVTTVPGGSGRPWAITPERKTAGKWTRTPWTNARPGRAISVSDIRATAVEAGVPVEELAVFDRLVAERLADR